MTPRTGRPTIEDPRSVVVTIRLTASEAERLAADAEAAGLTLSAHVRAKALGSPRARRPRKDA